KIVCSAAIIFVGRERGAQHINLFNAMGKHERRISLHAQSKLIPGALALAVLLIQIPKRVIQHRMNAALIHGEDSGWAIPDCILEHVSSLAVSRDGNVVK